MSFVSVLVERMHRGNLEAYAVRKHDEAKELKVKLTLATKIIRIMNKVDNYTEGHGCLCNMVRKFLERDDRDPRTLEANNAGEE